jgi:disulfide bond formation protein DsbB
MAGMSARGVHDFFAVLAIVAAAGVVAMVIARVVPSVATVRFLDGVHRVQLPLAALVATTATAGSIYFSEFAYWRPCRFCWFQRIFMYSVALLLVVAAGRRDRGVKWYAVPLAGVGILFSLWHNLLERGVVQESAACKASQPCANPFWVSFGHYNSDARPAGFPSITLAVMAFVAFAAILALLLLPESLEDEEDGQPAAG